MPAGRDACRRAAAALWPPSQTVQQMAQTGRHLIATERLARHRKIIGLHRRVALQRQSILVGLIQVALPERLQRALETRRLESARIAAFDLQTSRNVPSASCKQARRFAAVMRRNFSGLGRIWGRIPAITASARSVTRVERGSSRFVARHGMRSARSSFAGGLSPPPQPRSAARPARDSGRPPWRHRAHRRHGRSHPARRGRLRSARCSRG